MTVICQSRLPVRPWSDPRLNRLPGLVPLGDDPWPVVDEAYAAQMAYRAELLAREGDRVLRQSDGARPALDELYGMVLARLAAREDFRIGDTTATCPDGRQVALDPSRPLETLNALVQEDLCVMEKPEGADEHVLTAALLCFPANWTLAEKFMRPLVRIHKPVASYDADIARRVQRLFDGVQAGRPVWRANALVHDDADLFQPKPEGAPRAEGKGGEKWLRSERQTLIRLPETRAVLFSIHTYVLPFSRLDPADRAILSARES